jgi:hypothetical protein
MDWTKLTSNLADFVVSLKPSESKTIEYTVVTRW